MVKEYQVVADPDRLRVAGVTLKELRSAIENGNGASGGSVIELAEAEYMVRASAYVQSVEDLERIPVRVSEGAVPLTCAILPRSASTRAAPWNRRTRRRGRGRRRRRDYA